MAAILVNAVPLVSQEVGGTDDQVGVMVGQVGVMVGQVGVMVGQVVERHLTGCHLVLITTSRHSHVSSGIIRRWNGDMEAGVVVEAGPVTSQDQLDHLLQGQDQLDHLLQGQDQLDHLLQGLWTDARTTCRGLVLDLTSINNTNLILALVEKSGLWRLPETVVIAIGGRAGVRAVLLHHSLRNTVHALYLALHHDLYLALHHASLHHDLYLALNLASLHSINLTLNDTSFYIYPRFGTSWSQRPKEEKEFVKKVLNQLEMPSPNRSVAASFDEELRREQNYNMSDLLSYVQTNIPSYRLSEKMLKFNTETVKKSRKITLTIMRESSIVLQQLIVDISLNIHLFFSICSYVGKKYYAGRVVNVGVETLGVVRRRREGFTTPEDLWNVPGSSRTDSGSVGTSHHRGTGVVSQECKELSSSVRVYRRCLYCNTGEPDVQLVHHWCLTSLPLPLDDLFHAEQFHNLMGHKIKFSTMPFFPYMDYRSNNNEQGSSVILVDSLNTRLFLDFDRRLNVSFEVQDQPEHSWGVEKSGKFSGMMGQLQREEIDVCGPLAPHNERIKVMEFLSAYRADVMKIVSLKPTSLPQHLSPIRPFSGKLWLALLVSMVAWGVTLWLLQRAWQWAAGGRLVELSTALLYSWGALLQNPASVSPVSSSSSGRVLVGTWLVFCVVMITGYSSSLMAHLTIVGKTTPPETFEDLVSRDNWKWGIESYILNGVIVLYFTKQSDPVVKEIYRKMQALTITEALEKVKKGGYSFLSSKHFISITVASRYADKQGQTPFYISKNEIAIFLSFGLGFRKGSPLFPRVEQLVQRLEVSGIMQHWTDELVAKRVRDEKEAAQQDHSVLLDNTTHHDGREVKLGLQHLQGAFYFLILGSCVAFLTLLGENLAHCCSSPQ
ncbi:uncharacterized protein [Procambarus clarkii]|uniref:uncharacterized protein n=1 Tax=Procambarus clarkii TaxID=6728 RepID=UPI0037436027